MSSYTNCLLQGYGVLPGAPTRLHLTNIDTDYAVVHWAPPAALPDTVQHYNLHYKALALEDDYTILKKVCYYVLRCRIGATLIYRHRSPIPI